MILRGKITKEREHEVGKEEGRARYGTLYICMWSALEEDVKRRKKVICAVEINAGCIRKSEYWDRIRYQTKNRKKKNSGMGERKGNRRK